MLKLEAGCVQVWHNGELIMFGILFLLFVFVFAVNQITSLHKLYLAFHFFMMLWPLCHHLISVTSDPEFQNLMLKTAYFSMNIVGYGWLWFTLVLIRGVQELKWKSLTLTAVPLVIVTVLIFANPGDGFYRVSGGDFGSREYGPLFWVFLAVNIGYCVIALIAMLRAVRSRTSLKQRNQLILFAAGIVILILFAFLDSLLSVVLDPSFRTAGLTSLGIILSDLCFVVAIQRYNAFEIIDVALRDVIHHMTTGVVVVDTQNIVLEANRSMRRFMNVRIGEPLLPERDGHPTGEQDFAELLRRHQHPNKSSQFEYSFPTGEVRHVIVQISPILSRMKALLGHAITIQDVTEYRNLIRRLNSKNAELHRQNEEMTMTQKELFLANQRLEEMAIRDSLTGCFNRRYLNQYLEREVLVSRRYSRSFSILLFDIDLFKNINDTYGHLIGDEVLRSTAKVVMDCLRQSDMLARYGGEEFAIYLPETGEQEAMAIAQRIRAAVENNEVQTKRGPIRVTISIGIMVCRPSEFPNEDPKELLDQFFSRADAALYAAKNQGRNRIITG
jgi:diguanylate cyclase (GGDEF)-like protein